MVDRVPKPAAMILTSQGKAGRVREILRVINNQLSVRYHALSLGCAQFAAVCAVLHVTTISAVPCLANCDSPSCAGSEEDEFFLAPEDEETAQLRVEALKREHAAK